MFQSLEGSTTKLFGSFRNIMEKIRNIMEKIQARLIPTRTSLKNAFYK